MATTKKKQGTKKKVRRNPRSRRAAAKKSPKARASARRPERKPQGRRRATPRAATPASPAVPSRDYRSAPVVELPSGRLSANFELSEFTRSQTASREGIPNEPPADSIPAIQKLVDEVLQPARDAFGLSMNINSGYRSLELNRAIGGSSTSQHMWTAEHAAADIEIFGADNLELAHWIEENCDYDQLISECYDPAEGPNSGWVHVSIKVRGRNRKESLTYQRGEGYTPGLPPL